MKKAFVAVSESYQLASHFLPGQADRDFYLSYSHEFPDLSDYEITSYWMAGGYAARMHRAGLASSLAAPGQSWLSSVDKSLTRRKIVTGAVSMMPEDVLLFAKPAESKIDAILAGKYRKSEIEEICARDGISSNQQFQWSESILKMNHEHRFFVAHGKVVTGSPYLIDGVVYHPGLVSPYFTDALKAAESILTELGENQPPAFTLDVARDETSEAWLIVEANPAWSSGIYGCDPSLVIDVLEVACNNTEDRWMWAPSDFQVRAALDTELMRIVDISEATEVFLKSS